MRAFISYSHKDESFRAELDKHLALLKRQQLIDVWSDHCIRPGRPLTLQLLAPCRRRT